MALTKFNYNSFNITPVASKALAFNSGANGLTTASEGSMVLIKEQTASSSATVDFVDGTSDVVLDNTYPIYVFKYINCHPANDDVNFQVNFRDGSTAYDATKMTTTINSHHDEADTNTDLSYSGSFDLDQSTGVQFLAEATGNGNDECVSGELTLFNPSSTTFVKNFLAQTNNYYKDNFIMKFWVAGYCNVTAAIDGVQFTFESGNIDSGTIKMYGMKDS